MSICVLYENNNNRYHTIVKQFNRQNYLNKILVILDTMNSTVPLDVPVATNIKYINPLHKLNIEFEANNNEIMKHSKSVKEITSNMNVETMKKNEVEKTLNKLEKSRTNKATTSSQEDHQTIESEILKVKTNLQNIIDKIKKLEDERSSHDNMLINVKKMNEDTIRQISQVRSKETTMNDLKSMIIEETNTDAYTIMEEGFEYHPSHLENLIRPVMQSVGTEVVTYNNVFFRDTTLCLRESNHKKIILPLSLFKRDFFSKNIINSSSTRSFSRINNRSVLITKPSPEVKNVFNKTVMVYSHNKSKILRLFNLH